MTRAIAWSAAVVLACGSGDATSRLSIALRGDRTADGTAVLDVAAGSTRTVALVAVGPGAAQASFSCSAPPAFATCAGALLTLAPREQDVGSHAFEIIASAPGSEAATLRVVANVASACSACGADETCGGGGTPGVCGSPRWARWVSAFGTQEDDAVHRLAVDAAGTIYAVGRRGADVLFLRAYDPGGALVLEKLWPSASFAYFPGLAVRPAGGVVLTISALCAPGAACPAPDLGASAGEGSLVAALDASGNAVWQRDSGPFDAQGVGVRPMYGPVASRADGTIATIGRDASGPFLALLGADGSELWRRPHGDLSARGATLVVDDAGRITSLDWAVPPTRPNSPALVQYDGSGATNWRVPLDVRSAAIAALPGGDIVLADVLSADHLTLRRYAGADGALTDEASFPPLYDAMLVADANRIALLGNTPACDARVLASYDFASYPVSSVTLGPCSAFTPWALALAPDGAAVAAGSFSAPFDFSTGTKLAPRGADAFVVELSR